MPKTYAIKANRTPQDVLADNDITLEIGYSIEEARIASIAIQKTGEFVAVWIEEERVERFYIIRVGEVDRRESRAGRIPGRAGDFDAESKQPPRRFRSDTCVVQKRRHGLTQKNGTGRHRRGTKTPARSPAADFIPHAGPAFQSGLER